MYRIITISVTTGYENSTVGKLLAKKVKYRFMSMGDLRGEIAINHVITIDQLNAIGEKNEKLGNY